MARCGISLGACQVYARHKKRSGSESHPLTKVLGEPQGQKRAEKGIDLLDGAIRHGLDGLHAAKECFAHVP